MRLINNRPIIALILLETFLDNTAITVGQLQMLGNLFIAYCVRKYELKCEWDDNYLRK